MSTRLLKSTCVEVVEKLIKENIRAKMPAWIAEGAQLAKDIYETSYSAATRATIEVFDAELFAGNRRRDIYFRIGEKGISGSLYFSGQVRELPSPLTPLYDLRDIIGVKDVTILLPYASKHVIDETSDLGLRLKAYTEADYSGQLNRFENTVKIAARTCTK